MTDRMTDRLQVLIPDNLREDLDDLRDGGSVGPHVREALWAYVALPRIKRKIAKNRRER